MKKKLNSFLYLALILMSFSTSTSAHAEISFTSAWQSLLRFLQFDLTKEVNRYVSPPERQCIDQNVGRAALLLPPVSKPALRQEQTKLPAVPEKTENVSVRNKIMANYVKLGGDPIALKQSLCFFDKNKGTKFKAAGDPSRPAGIGIDNQRYITINDMNSSMSKSRFYVIDMETGKVSTYFSSHGYGGKKGVPESDMYADGVSNIDGSNASPRGFFITGSRREGSSDPRWKFSMKLHGLQKGINDNSFSRAVIVHPFGKMPSESASSDNPEATGPLRSTGPFTLSKGCPMLSEKHASKIIDQIKAPSNSKGGSLYYNYSAAEKSMGAGYCGDEGLMKK